MGIRNLHLVSFSSPVPPDYGGAIDVYYKIKSLESKGIKVILHVFLDKKNPSLKLLLSLCTKVYIYKREVSFKNVFSSMPFIVNSRNSKVLLDNLRKDEYPILFEGTHTSFYLKYDDIQARSFLRLHNIESRYYTGLSKNENQIFRRLFFKLESVKLKKYEDKLFKKDLLFFPISGNDNIFLKNLDVKTNLVYPFHSSEKVSSKIGRGNYILYHGNMEIRDNELAARRIIEYMKGQMFKLIIAGRKANEVLADLNNNSQIEIIGSPDENKMNLLIENAHINVVYSNQSDGIKLKLINSLFRGRFCLANSNSITDEKLINTVEMFQSKSDFVDKFKKLVRSDFSENELKIRISNLQTFANNYNVDKLIGSIYKK